MTYLGDINLNDTIDFKFTTVDTTGAPSSLGGSAAIAIYPDNSTTEITAGVTTTTNFDSRVGLNQVRLVATSTNGFASGSNYQAVVTTGTVGGISVVGYVVGQFSIEKRSALRPTTVGRTLDVSSGGEAGIDWANVGTPSNATNLSGTTVSTITNPVTTGTISNNAITNTAIQNGAISNSKYAAGAISDTTFATDAISSTAISAAAVTKIQAGLPTAATIAAVQTTVSSILNQTGTVGVVVGTNNDKVNYSVSTIGANVITSTAIDASAVTKIQTGLPTAATIAAVQTTVSSILNQTGTVGVVVGTNNDKIGYAVGAGGITSASFAANAVNAAALATDAVSEIADGVLNRDLAMGSSGGARNVQSALRAIRNKVDGSTGTLTVYQEDDATPAWTAALTRSTIANPVVTVDP